MSSQLEANKSVLILGDSNVERYLLHTGRLYCQYGESVPTRNLTEFNTAIHQIPTDKYRMVVLAMMTNIIINTGNEVTATDLSSRLTAIKACLKPLILTIT